jgi:hypothetical protein
MPTNKQHKKPLMPKEALESENVAKKLYYALTLKTAPRATPTGYVLGVCTLLKILIDQAEKQGSNKEQLKAQAIDFISKIE